MNLACWFHLVYFGIVLPLQVIRARHKHFAQNIPLPNRLRNFQGTALFLSLCGIFSFLIAYRKWIPVFPPTVPPTSAMLAGVAMYVVCVVFMLPRWRKAAEQRSPIAYLFMPSNATERAWWIIVAVLAGVSEEITWRYVQVALLTELTGNYWLSALASAISFAVAHSVQGLRSVLIIVLFALGFQILVWLAGSLYVAMAVHVAYNITAGLMYGKLGKQLDYLADKT